ncbi:MAG: lamin tail domain-containing protein [Phycisphaeraceae bacterium]|nr:lamin tail domain-containing protein [Phycisphaeraceae bacterium]
MSMKRTWSRLLCCGAALLLGTAAADAQVKISQIYGGGGNTGATFTHDFVELFNAGNAAVDVTGWSLQYASAGGAFQTSNNQITNLPSVSIQPGQYYLIQLASGGSNGVPLPVTADLIGSTNMSATSGKVALARITTALGTTPGACTDANIEDLVGFGSPNCAEGTAAPSPSVTTAIFRSSGGCQDTQNNSADFSTGTPNPRNTASTFNPCMVMGPTGACCFANGTCGVITEADCMTAGGSYQGDNVTCMAAMCPQPMGACCVGTMCSVTTSADCTTLMGEFTLGGNCSPSLCEFAQYNLSATNEEACVMPGSGSIDLANTMLLDLCRGGGVNSTAAANAFNSNGWTATSEAEAVLLDDYISFGLDIAPGFEATITHLAFRLQRSGTGPNNISIRSSADGFSSSRLLISGVPTSAPSTPVVFDINDVVACGTLEFRLYAWGASAGTGTLRVQGATGAVRMIGSVGAPTTCAGGGDPSGACCLGNGACIPTSASICLAAGGTYQGNGSSCMDADCPLPTGACCVGLFCQITTEPDCLAFGGTFILNGMCDPLPCVEAMGACCFPDGMCQVLTSSDCSVGGGVFAGNNTTCVDRPCTFACCFADGTCQVLTVNDCVTAGGIANTANATCSPNQCTQPPALGACCVGTNCTASMTWSDCVAMSGIWLGKGTTCAAGACDQASSPTLVALYDFDVNRQALSFTITTDATPPFPLGDAFGVVQRFRLFPEPEPFVLLDDTVNLFPGDTIGVIRESKVDSCFGVADVFNIIMTDADTEAVAEWEFDIAGRTGITVSVDIAAMGNFEATVGVVDRYTFEIAVDNGPFTVVFDGRADESIVDFEYTMASGALRTFNDPLRDQVSDTIVDNVFTTFTWPVAGVGSTLQLRFRAMCDGGDEAFAFDNITVSANPVGDPTGACCTGNGCVIASQALCEGILGGAYEGNNTTCTPDPCVSTPCPGDYNDDGVVDLADLLDFLGDWNPNLGQSGMGLPGDINGDNVVDLADLLEFLGDWNPNLGSTCP